MPPHLQRRRLLQAALLAPSAVLAASPGQAPALQLPPCQSSEVTTPDGVRIAVQSWGNPDGLPVVFVHGLSQSRLCWIRQLDGALARRYRLITYDLRGHGTSDKPLSEPFYSEGRRWGDELAAVMGVAGPERIGLVGWSLGGLVILNYLAQHGPERVAAINLVDAWTSLDPSLYTAQSGDLTDALRSTDFLTRLSGMRTFLRACFHRQPDPDLFGIMLAYNALPPIEFHRGIEAATLPEAEAALRGLRGPVLVTHGAKDRLFTLGMAEHTARSAPGSQLSVYPGAGHSPFLEDSARFNAELGSLLGRAFG